MSSSARTGRHRRSAVQYHGDHVAGTTARLEQALITGLQTLRMVGLGAAFVFLILVLPATIVAAGPFFSLSRQLQEIGFILVAGAGAALLVRWLHVRETDSPRTAQELALQYRSQFFQQAAAAQIPGLLAFLMSLFARPYPFLAILLGVAFTVGLAVLVGPTERNLDRLEDEARRHNIQGSVRGALDELYSWRP